MQNNSYHDALIALGRKFFEWQPAEVIAQLLSRMYSHWKACNEWGYGEMASVFMGSSAADLEEQDYRSDQTFTARVTIKMAEGEK